MVGTQQPACSYKQSTILIHIMWRRNNSTERNSEVCSTKRTHCPCVWSDSFAVSPCKMKRPVFHTGRGGSCGIPNGRKSVALLSDAHTNGGPKLYALTLNTRYVCIWYPRSRTVFVIQPVASSAEVSVSSTNRKHVDTLFVCMHVCFFGMFCYTIQWLDQACWNFMW